MKPVGFFRRVDDLAGIYKVPNETVDYSLDWTSELQTGQTISSASWTVPAGLTSSSAGVSGAVTTRRIAGGTAGTDYKVVCAITKSNGEVVPRSFVISVVADLS